MRKKPNLARFFASKKNSGCCRLSKGILDKTARLEARACKNTKGRPWLIRFTRDLLFSPLPRHTWHLRLSHFTFRTHTLAACCQSPTLSSIRYWTRLVGRDLYRLSPGDVCFGIFAGATPSWTWRESSKQKQRTLFFLPRGWCPARYNTPAVIIM